MTHKARRLGGLRVRNPYSLGWEPGDWLWLLRWRLGSAEMRAAYALDRHPFVELLARESATLVCCCPSSERCHRTLLAEILVKLGARPGEWR